MNLKDYKARLLQEYLQEQQTYPMAAVTFEDWLIERLRITENNLHVFQEGLNSIVNLHKENRDAHRMD